MLALAAAFVAALYLILDWAGVGSDLFNAHTGLLICVLLLSLHFAGFATDWRRGRTRT